MKKGLYACSMDKIKKTNKLATTIINKLFNSFHLSKKYSSIINTILFLFFPFVIITILEIFNKDSYKEGAIFLFDKGYIALFDYIFILVISVFLSLIFSNRYSVIIMIITSLTMGISNLIKFELRGENLFPWDIFMASKSSELISFVDFGSNSKIIFVPILALLYVILIFSYTNRTKRSLKIRVSGVIISLMILVYVFSYQPSYKFAEQIVYKTNNMHKSAIFLAPKDNYSKNGFVMAFYLNFKNIVSIEKPENYSKEKVYEIIEELLINQQEINDEKDKNIDNQVKPDVIVFFSEAFFDLEKIPNIDFSKELVPNFKKYGEEGTLKKVISPRYGGGTADCEFEFYTGHTLNNLPAGSIPNMQYINDKTYSIVWNFRDEGYETVALHTYDEEFFNRKNVYPFLGYNRMYFDKDFKNPYILGNFISDRTITERVMEEIEKMPKDQPIFISALTMQNHQDYMKNYEKQIDVETQFETTEKEQYLLENCANGIYYSDLEIEFLVEYLRKSERKTILIFLGDHLPSLGPNASIYKKAGYVSEDIDVFGNSKLNEQEFILWSNYDLDKKAISKDSYKLYELGEKLIDLAKINKSKQYKVYKAIWELEDIDKAKEYQKIIQYDIMFGEKYINDY